jgi:hypothetical protein
MMEREQLLEAMTPSPLSYDTQRSRALLRLQAVERINQRARLAGIVTIEARELNERALIERTNVLYAPDRTPHANPRARHEVGAQFLRRGIGNRLQHLPMPAPYARGPVGYTAHGGDSGKCCSNPALDFANGLFEPERLIGFAHSVA